MKLLVLSLASASALQLGGLHRPLSAARCAVPCARASDEAVGLTRAEVVRYASAGLVTVAASKPAEAAYPGLVIETTQGTMEFELWDDVAPKHVESFVNLAKKVSSSASRTHVRRTRPW